MSEQTDLLTSLSDEELALAKVSAHAALASQEYLSYFTFMNPTHQTPLHIRVLCAYLDLVEKGVIKQLLVIEPPRHGKSETTSGNFPSYCIGKDPTRTVMITSYAATLAEVFSIQNRDTIADNPHWPLVFPNVRMSTKVKGRDKWAVQGARETCIAAGVGGSITGLGCWLLLMDDLVKNYEEAVSVARQEAIWNWYTTTARTRLTPDGREVVIGTRWAENDFIDRLLKSEEGKNFVVLHLPALSYGSPEEYEALYPQVEDRAKVLARIPKTAFPDPLGRPKDEPLWPGRFSFAFLQRQKFVLGHDFEALYQGNPSAPEGHKFKSAWFRGITPLVLSHLKLTTRGRARSYDLAWARTDRANYTAGLRATLYELEEQDFNAIQDEQVRAYLNLVGIPPIIIVLEHMLRYKEEWDEGSEKIVKQALEDGERYELLVEAIASQSVGIKSLKRDRRLWKHNLYGVNKNVDKEVNAKYALRLASQGCIFVLYPNATTPPLWELEFLGELGAFPNGSEDDQVDALSQLVNHWQPIIDQILQSTTKGIWQTPFMAAPPSVARKLPPEFIEYRPTLVGQSMGWFV